MVYMGTASFLLNVEVSCGLYGHSLIPFKCRGQLWSIWAQPHVEVNCGLYGHSLGPFKCRGQLWSIWAQPTASFSF